MHAHLDLSIWICSDQKSMMVRGRGQHRQHHTPGQGLGGGMASSGCVVRSCGLPGVGGAPIHPQQPGRARRPT